MNKQIKDILTNSLISVKWKNGNTWQKEDCKNLYDIATSRHITYKLDKNNDVTIVCNHGTFKIIYKSYLSGIEQGTINVIKMFYQYLGDTTKITTYWGTVYKIN